ncbi:MAG: hypothetical protein ACO1Q7_18600 [Gemmatimonas sp.]
MADTLQAAIAISTDSTANTGARDSTASDVVRTGMQNVNMHVEPGIVLGIKRLKGTVLSTSEGDPPALNKKQSMLIDIESADITIDTVSLANMLNRHVFGYPNAPLRNLHVSIDGDEMVQTGSMKKGVWLRFRIRASMSLTPQGEIRVHPNAVSVLGIGVKKLSQQLGGMSKLIKLEPGHGARLDGDDFILSPTEMLPPPKIRGRLSSIRLYPGGVRQTFGSSDAVASKPDMREGSTAKNFMYFHGGILQFGKLTMSGTDLEILDGDESNPFDYSLDKYQEHPVAGHSNTTDVDGLIVVMPDLQQMLAGKPLRRPDPDTSKAPVKPARSRPTLRGSTAPGR